MHLKKNPEETFSGRDKHFNMVFWSMKPLSKQEDTFFSCKSEQK